MTREGEKLTPGTKKVTKYTNRDGIAVVWDTPGFGIDGEETDKQKVEVMARECEGKVDLILYCIRMDCGRWPKNSDFVTFRIMTEAFGSEIWRYCQFVLTFANRVVGFSQEEEDDPDQFFSQKELEFEENVRKALKDHGHLSDEEIEEIHVVAVGDPRPHRRNKSWKLPTTDDWFVELWLAVSQRIQQSALSTLLQLNRHRIDSNEDSVNPSEETHLRNVPYHAVYLSEHTEVPDISLDSSSEVPTPLPSLADPAGEQATLNSFISYSLRATEA